MGNQLRVARYKRQVVVAPLFTSNPKMQLLLRYFLIALNSKPTLL
jgi:hypothetical protein